MTKPIIAGVKDLIIEYFNCDIFALYQLSAGIIDNIIETFTFAYNHHLNYRQISAQLSDSNISDLRDRIRSYNNPFPIRLGHFRPKIQEEAYGIKNGTVHQVIRDIIAEHYKCQSKKSVKLSPTEINNKLLMDLLEAAKSRQHHKHLLHDNKQLNIFSKERGADIEVGKKKSFHVRLEDLKIVLKEEACQRKVPVKYLVRDIVGFLRMKKSIK